MVELREGAGGGFAERELTAGMEWTIRESSWKARAKAMNGRICERRQTARCKIVSRDQDR